MVLFQQRFQEREAGEPAAEEHWVLSLYWHRILKESYESSALGQFISMVWWLWTLAAHWNRLGICFQNTAVLPAPDLLNQNPRGRGSSVIQGAARFEQKWSWKGVIWITCALFRVSPWFQIFIYFYFFGQFGSTASFYNNTNAHAVEFKHTLLPKFLQGKTTFYCECECNPPPIFFFF